MRRWGSQKRAQSRAARTRSRDSRTLVSARPTIWVAGRPPERCTSTRTSGHRPRRGTAVDQRQAHMWFPAEGCLMLRQVLFEGYRKLLVNGLGGFWQSIDPLKLGL